MTSFDDVNTIAHYHYGHIGPHDHTHSFANHTHTLNLYPSFTQPQEPKMTTLQKVADERREARERERIEAAYDEYDDANYDEFDDGTVLRFDVSYKRDHDYTYAALRAAGRWYLTGSTCHGVSTEDFYAWLIEHRVDARDVTVLS